MHWKNFGTLIYLLIFISGYQIADAQQEFAKKAYAVFEQHCLNCHGEGGRYADDLTIQYDELIETRAVIPRDPDNSELYKRLLGNTDRGSQMPLGQEPLDNDKKDTIRRWIEAGAPNWGEEPPKQDFCITPEAMLKEIYDHVEALDAFDRPFARYFTLTHLYNAGTIKKDLRAYRNALSKLINSLSWDYEVAQPKPIDKEKTIYHIDLRHYEWNKNDRWYQIEQAYPYRIDFKSPMYITVLQETRCEVPFVRADWFIATASLPPLYHEILDLPETTQELEAELDVDVEENIQEAPGKRVWRAGFNNSRVSQNNRVVERHKSRYGAYWKSYDFASSVGTKNIFEHPLDFKHDGGEIIFNLPNGLQAYYVSDASGKRLDEAPTNIVSVSGAQPPEVRNGLSCMRCHTKGMRPFTDEVRLVIEQHLAPPFDEAQALRLYTEKSEMDALIEEDTQRYKEAIEAAGGDFDEPEPIQKLVDAYERLLDAEHAAAEVGLKTNDFLEKIDENGSLQKLGLLALKHSGMKRDNWETQFSKVTFILDLYTDTVLDSVDESQFDPDMVPAALGNGNIEVTTRSVSFSPDGRRLAIGSDNGKILLLDAVTGEHLTTFTAGEGYVDITAFSPDGHLLASLDITVFDAEQRRINNGETQDEDARLWDVNTGQNMTNLSSTATFINVAFNTNGNPIGITASTNGDISSWGMYAKGGHLKNFIGHEEYVDTAVLSPDGSILASGSRDRTIRLWNTVTGEHLQTLKGHNSSILSIAFSPDGRVLASGSDGEILLWNASTGQYMQTLAGHTGRVSSLAFNVNGRILAGGSDGEILLWDFVTGKQLEKLSVDGYVNGLDFSPDGSRLASAVAGSFYLWDIVTSTPVHPADVNGDGKINVLDIVVLSRNLGPVPIDKPRMDVNDDCVISILDLVLVAGAIGSEAGAPSMHSQSMRMLTASDVQKWLTQAQQLNITDAISQRGILFLEYLLAALTLKDTVLLANYPNPFNPETWIPYQLAAPADVTVTIYAINGAVVRTLSLGHQPIGIYQDKGRAAYWDGKNALGESVASGVYFYTLTAGDFIATRKMLIRK